MLYLHKIANSVWMIEPSFASNYLPLITQWLQGKPATTAERLPFVNLATPQATTYQVRDWGRNIPENAPTDSVAIIRITDAITKYDQECGPVGMLTMADLLRRCYANSNIKAIALVIDSGGGEAHAMFLMNQVIGERNKPVAAFIDDMACSAAYGIASACDWVTANSDIARVGSIGTYLTLADYSEKLKMEGINLIEIYATASKDKNSEFMEALKGNLEPLRTLVNRYNDQFLSTIAANRSGKLKGDASSWGTGKTYFAPDAVAIGLIDNIDTFDNFINYFNT